MTTRSILTRGAQIFAEDAGASEPALVFLHYWGGLARTWRRVLADLPDSIRAIALNQRGWGGSTARDGRYDLDALADDVMDVVMALGVSRYVLVGHSMGGKVAQVLAGRGAPGLLGMVLIAPAPPEPMKVPADVRAGMLASYQSREGVLEALKVLAGPSLGADDRQQVIEDTLRGDADAKRYWPEQGMLADVSSALSDCRLPTEILIGEFDKVEQEAALRPTFERYLQAAAIHVAPGAGHLMPLETPSVIVSACQRMLALSHE